MPKEPKPTEKGDCLQVASNLMIEIPNALLVHAKIDGQGKLKGKRILHAWIELNGYVLDFSNKHHFVMRRENYYKIANPNPIKKYSREEAMKLMHKTKHFAQWDKCFG